ncbi:MAG: PAS domain S-box protein [Candidatus Aminicenantales bacterium]
MDDALRNTGIRALGRVPWGTHFCQFYKTRGDLLDILVPYFKAGLDHNEACMWICSDPLSVEDATRALGRVVPDLGARLKKGQIEILPHTEWYLRKGRFGAKRVLDGWAKKLDAALAQGWDGLRLSGNTFWLDKKDWARFMDYEAAIDSTIFRSRMLALCTYSLEKCGVQEIVDVLNNHKLTLIRRAGKWTLIESSGRKNVETELDESQRRLRMLFESNIIGIITGDRHHLSEANEAFLKLVGCDRKDLEAGRIHWRSMVPPEFRRKDGEALKRLRKKGMGRPFEIEYVCKDGSRAYLLIGSAVIEASPLRWASFVIDLSNQKRAELALRKALAGVEKRVRLRTSDLAGVVRQLRREVAERRRVERALSQRNRILDARFASGINPLVILDRHFNFIRVNKAYASTEGMKVEDFEGRNHFKLFPNRGNEEIFKRVIRLRKPFQAKAKSYSSPRHPEKGVTYWDWTLDPVLDERGEVDCLVFALNDVTEQTRAHGELRRSELLLRTVLDTLPVGVWITDKNGAILISNPAGQRIWAGVKKVKADAQGASAGWKADAKNPLSPEAWATSRAVARGITDAGEELEIECFDGRRKFVLNSALPIRDTEGGVTGAIVISQETTGWLEGERKNKEQAALLELAGDAIVVRDDRNRITFWNRGAEAIYGWTKEEALNRFIHRFLDTRFSQSLAEITDQVKKTGRWEGEISHVRKDGRRIVVESRWAVLKGGGAKTAHILEINRDISVRKDAEEALRQASSYTRGLIETSLDPLVAISPTGKITDVNKATEMATGVPRTELIGTDFSDYFTEPAKAREGYEKVFSEGSVRDYPLAIRHASGEVTEVLYNAAVFRDRAGSSVGVFAAARDISALKAAELERLRLATAIEQIRDGVSILDLDGRILSANPAFADHHGFRQEEVIGRPFRDVLRIEAEKKGIVAKMLAAMNEGRLWNWHFTQSLEGGIRELDLEVSPIRDGSGRLVNLIAVERDVTQEVVFQERIRQWQKMEALGTLAGGIAHDFNNLLLPILINTELMIDDRKDDDASIHRLSQILEAARRGQNMVKQIIAFSQRKEQERQPVEISPIIKESLEFLSVSMSKNIRISQKIEAESAMALADPTQIHQVLVNLGTNAAFAMRENGGVLEVGLSKTFLEEEAASQHIDLKPGEYLRLTVKDTGTGMTPEVASRAFEPFFTTKKTGEGTGMGLAVAHGIVKGHGGHISLRSEPGKGTIFTIYLPLVEGRPPLHEETRAPFPKGTERVLFVDDEDIQVRAMSRLLEHLGYRVAGMTDSRAALELLRRDPAAFDLAIMDQTMPNLSGVELAREALSLRPDLPLILCTGYSETINEEQALAMGIKAFMLKPFSAKEIAVTIRRVLSRKS